MRLLFVVCEGQTEESFVRQVLAPAFYDLGLNLIGQTIETSPGHKGGGLEYERVQKHVQNSLNQSERKGGFVTTFFDLFRLRNNFPGYEEAQTKNQTGQKLAVLTTAFHEDIVGRVGCRPERFIPYFQPYEFEALLFSHVPAIVNREESWGRWATALASVVERHQNNPEEINHRPGHNPVAQLERYLENPGYKKTRHGPVIAEAIGLTRLEEACPTFRGWLERLRAIPTLVD